MALAVARWRALHQIADYPLVFEDPLSLLILGPEAIRQIQELRTPQIVRSSASVRAFLVARSRFTEDRLAAALEDGVRQYVILGAGLDTYPYRPRAPRSSSMTYYEVDAPDAQAWKRDCLREAGISTPQSLAYVPADFSKDDLSERMATVGFRFDQPAFFSFLGVAIFLAESEVMTILRFVASLPEKTQIVFDYGIPSTQLDEGQYRQRARAMHHSASLGEPLRTFFDTDCLIDELTELGFAQTVVLDGAELNRLYFTGRADGLRVAPGGRRVMVARR
jgi:methyltransferase (TIGR00027 family)